MPEPRNPLSSGDEPTSPTAGTDQDEIRATRAANRFDIRRIIGGLFILYSLILIALGIFGSSHVKHKAAGINVDLWTGLAMLVFGALMVFWALYRPTLPEPPDTRGDGSGDVRGAPAT
jgi:hypothetical protein